jgi:hypothetical protein
VALLMLLLCGTGIAAALWQHFVAAASSSCNLTLADKVLSATMLDTFLPDVFQPRASCADAAVDLLGVPYEFWSLALYAAIESAVVWDAGARARHAGTRGRLTFRLRPQGSAAAQRSDALMRSSAPSPGHSTFSSSRFSGAWQVPSASCKAVASGST